MTKDRKQELITALMTQHFGPMAKRDKYDPGTVLAIVKGLERSTVEKLEEVARTNEVNV